MELNIIAKIHTDFPTKFGIPRQSGLVEELKACIVFEPEYRVVDAVRGLEEFSYIWLLWLFSENLRSGWSPTVRPPRLGGNKRMGVFSTRSPFRPNAIGLSSVKLDRVEISKELGPILHVSGADLMDGTPIFDIKPYLPYVDSHPGATGGFAASLTSYALEVDFPEDLLERVKPDRREGLVAILKQDPRPAYQKDPQRVYGFPFGDREIKFTVDDERGVLTVCAVEEC